MRQAEELRILRQKDFEMELMKMELEKYKAECVRLQAAVTLKPFVATERSRSRQSCQVDKPKKISFKEIPTSDAACQTNITVKLQSGKECAESFPPQL